MKMRETSRAQDKKLADKNTLKKLTQKIPEIKEKFISQCSTKALGEYCWKTMMLPQLSYSFSEVHSLFYSFVGIQTLVLATQYPEVYWNTACLIVNSQSTSLMDTANCDNDSIQIDDIEDLDTEPADQQQDSKDEEEETEENDLAAPKKKKGRAVPYGKIASAMGKIIQQKVRVSLPDINKSTYTFTPDVEHNMIRYGLSGIAKINEDAIKAIISGRPYTSLQDFLTRVKLTKPQMFSLIKSGAFDGFGERGHIMRQYVNSICDVKKRLSLQNLKMLIDYDLIPENLDFQKRLFNFNKYIKKFKIDAAYYGLDNIAFNFFDAHFDVDFLESTDETESGVKIKQTVWDKIYKINIDPMRVWIKENEVELLEKVNEAITEEVWDQNCGGSLAKWEMESVSFYFHPHELEKVDMERYGFSNFFSIPEQPVVEKTLHFKGKDINMLKLYRICGTVLDRDKAKKSVTLLTTEGVVNVKIFGPVFAQYDRQISEKDAEGKKHVLRKSDFTRGNKIAVCGIRDGSSFRAKKYKSTPFHLVEVIDKVYDNGLIEVAPERAELEEQ